MRRITTSCPRCRNEFAQILIHEAENILFNGCDACRAKDAPAKPRAVRNQSRL